MQYPSRALPFLLCLLLLSSCSLPWQQSKPIEKAPDILEKSFAEDLAWVDNYGMSEYGGESVSAGKNVRTWKRYRHPSLPISFAYPLTAKVTQREIDLDRGDKTIDIQIHEPNEPPITIVFQRNISELTHIASSEKKILSYGGITGTYYNARNMENGNLSFEKFIANFPNSRYGIHIAGKGTIFHTLLTTLKTS